MRPSFYVLTMRTVPILAAVGLIGSTTACVSREVLLPTPVPIEAAPDFQSSIVGLRITAPTSEVKQRILALAKGTLLDTTYSATANAGDIVAARIWIALLPTTTLVDEVRRVTDAPARWVRATGLGRAALCAAAWLAGPLVSTALCWTYIAEAYHWVTDKVSKVIQVSFDEIAPADLAKVSAHVQIVLQSLEVLSVAGDRLRLRARLEIGAQLSGGLPFAEAGIASCGIDEPPVQVEVVDEPRLRWNKDGFIRLLESNPQITLLTPCKITAATININALIEEAMRIAKVKDKIAERLNVEPGLFTLKPRLARLWSRLNKPLPIQDSIKAQGTPRESAWIMVRPREVLLANFGGNDSLVYTDVGFSAKPYLIAGRKPEPTINPLVIDTLPFADTVIIATAAQITFKRAGDLLTTRFRKERDTLKTPFGEIKIAKVSIYGVNDSAVVVLHLRSPFRGIVALQGVPRYDISARAIVVDSLDYTVASKQLLVNVAEWLLHDLVKDRLRALSRIEVGAHQDRLLTQATKLAIPIDTMAVLRLTLGRATPTAIHLGGDALTVYAVAEGKGEVRLWSGGPSSGQ